jgi:NAD(P)-dependent dehydrogenase (short-subunit alcohol dehydrogenase family)
MFGSIVSRTCASSCAGAPIRALTRSRRSGSTSNDTPALEVGDLDVLINNAGISTDAPLLGPSTDNVRREFDTNFWGTLNVRD